ncbi:MAG TPA: GNAT family N-acetyltransferase [Silvibacterium sp.]|nr:GNAT family N-acetyltransferase [Silvibacterium sp.]
MMASLERINERNVWVYKAIRLRALQDSPTAFGSTYAREVQFPEAEWLRRAANMSGERGVGFLAMEKGAACGIVGALVDEDEADKAQVLSMWVAPESRRSGVGSDLIEAVRGWSRSRRVRTLILRVTSCNQGAIEFYARCGFTMTRNTEPYPNDSSLVEYEMTQLLASE